MSSTYVVVFIQTDLKTILCGLLYCFWTNGQF